MKQKLNYKNGEECLHATYEDMKDMTLDDAVFILSESVRRCFLKRETAAP